MPLTYDMLRDFMALPEVERVKVASDPSDTGQMMNDFLNLGGEGRRDVLDALRPSASQTQVTPSSVKQEIGPFNPLEYLKHPEVASTAIRTVPAIAGGMVGGLAGPIGAAAGGAAGSSLGYLIDQWRTGREVQPSVLSLEALLGAIPGGKTASTVARNVGKRALQGLGLGVGGGAARIGLEEERLPTINELIAMGATGTVMGGALGGGEWKLFGPRPAPPRPPISPQSGPRALPGGARLALPPATNPPTVDADPIPGLSEADIITAQRGMTKRGRAIDAKTMKDAMKAASEEQQARETIEAANAAEARRLREGGLPVQTPVARETEPADVLGAPPTPRTEAAIVADIDAAKAKGASTIPLRKELKAARQAKAATAEEPSVTLPAGEPTTPPAVAERMQGMARTLEDADIPTGLTIIRDADGNIIKKGNAGAKLPRFKELFPEIGQFDDLSAGKVIEAIKKDKGNPTYLRIKGHVEEQMAKEATNPTAVAERHPDFGDYEQFSKAFDEVVNAPEAVVTPPAIAKRAVAVRIGVTPDTPSGIRVMTPDGEGILNQSPAGKFAWVRRPSATKGVKYDLKQYPNEQLTPIDEPSAVKPPTATQPKLFQTQAETPPQGLQSKAQQVPHENLLEGMKPPEAPAPELPLTKGENIVELGMGLPVPEWAKRAAKTFFTGRGGRQAASSLQRMPTQFDRLLPGKQLGHDIEHASKLDDMYTGRFDQALKDSKLARLSPVENDNLMLVLDGNRARPMNAKVEQAAKVHRTALNAEDAHYRKLGQVVLVEHPWENATTGAQGTSKSWKPYQSVSNYYPHVPDAKRVARDSVARITQEIQATHPKLSRETANEIAQLWRARATGKTLPQVSQEAMRTLRIGQPMSPSLRERTFIIPDRYKMRPNDLLPLHYQQAAREMAVLEAIGPADKKIEDARKFLQSTQPDGWDVAMQTWDQWRGRITANPMERTSNKVIAFLNNLSTGTLLGPTTAVKQLSQVSRLTGLSSFKNFLKGAGPSFTKAGEREARAMGALADQMRQDFIEATKFGESFHPAHTPLDKALAGSERLANAVVSKTGITAADTIGRRWAYHTGKLDMLDWQRAAQGGNKKAVKLLAEAGLTPTSTLEEVQVAASKFADMVNLRSSPVHLPALMYNMPLAKLTTHLNRFNIAMTQDLVQNFIQPLGRAVADKNRSEIIRQLGRSFKYMAAMGIGGEVLADTLRTISGRPDDRPGGSLPEFADMLLNGQVPMTIVRQRLLDNLLFAGTGGYFQVLKEALIDPAGAAGKIGRISSLILGPTAGSIVEGVGRAADLVTASREPNPKTGKSPYETALSGVGRYAARRIPGAGQITAPRLFADSPANDKRRASSGYARALRANRFQDANEWLQWYAERQGRQLSPKAIAEAMTDHGQ